MFVIETKDFVIRESYVGLLYEDGAFKRILEPGKTTFKRRWGEPKVEREVTTVDLRERSLTIKGQEILTADKVAVRVSLLVYFRVTAPQAAVHEVANYEERIYEDVQLAARRFLAGRNLEAILSDRNEISEAVREAVKGAAEGYGVDIRRADVKDLVFPGNLREIMNQVLETERRAEAKLILARKEAEAKRIQAEAEREAARLRLEAEREQMRISAESESERVQLTAEADKARYRHQLETEMARAQAMADNPALLKLQQLATLSAMARTGGKFVIGLEHETLQHALDG